MLCVGSLLCVLFLCVVRCSCLPQDRNKVVRVLNELEKYLEENKGAGNELLELEEETKAFEAKLTEAKNKIDPILGKLYTPTSHESNDDEEASDMHEEL